MPILTTAANNPGSTVTLNAVWLNVASDPIDSLALSQLSQLQPATDQAGAVRAMASGSLRLVQQAVRARSYRLSAPMATRAQIEWLEAHIGVTLCVRDDRGRKFFAVYLSVPVDEQTFSRAYGDVSLALSEVTHSQAA